MTVQSSSAGKVLTIGDSEVCIKVSSRQTESMYELVQSIVPPGFSPPAHVHRSMLQAFYVLDGRISVQLDRDWVEANQGEVVLVPPGTPHTFANRTDVPAQLLQIQSGGALELMFEDLARAFPAGTAYDQARIGQIMAAHDHLPPKEK